MKCAWKELLSLVPQSMRADVNLWGREDARELRLRLGRPAELRLGTGSLFLRQNAGRQDLQFCINAATEYSPWQAATAASGYITAPGGHRIGLCGEAVVRGGVIRSMAQPTSVCIRIARDFPGIGKKLARITDSVLIVGSPGSGKTTLLRDLIRQISDTGAGSVAVVDERRELFPISEGQACFDTGCHTDILTGCPKTLGIENVLRTMGPQTIAVDEITAAEDAAALVHAWKCGVQLLATVHGASAEDIRMRPACRMLWERKVFRYLVIMAPDKSWKLERIAS